VLGKQEHDLTTQDNQLQNQLYAFRQEAIALERNVLCRTPKGTKPRPTASEENMMRTLLRKIHLLEKEKELKAQNLSLYNKQVSSISTLIVQKDTVHTMQKSVRAVADIGIDVDAMEKTIENAASSSDKLDLLSDIMATRLTDAALSTDSYVFGSGLPFAEFGGYTEYSNNSYNPEWLHAEEAQNLTKTNNNEGQSTETVANLY
jgi:hypothetical protein